jgi:hypothetical protein
MNWVTKLDCASPLTLFTFALKGLLQHRAIEYR